MFSKVIERSTIREAYFEDYLRLGDGRLEHNSYLKLRSITMLV